MDGIFDAYRPGVLLQSFDLVESERMIFLLATVSCISFTFCLQEFVADTMLGATQLITQSIHTR
jgi:hypothetical protein